MRKHRKDNESKAGPIQMVTAAALIQISYRISCAGKLLEASDLNQAIDYQMGEGMWPIQLELEMLNEVLGADLHIRLKASDDIFGKIDPERVLQLDSGDFSQKPNQGELIEFELPDGETIEGQVLGISGTQVEVDFNHPYAGRDLEMNIKIESILTNEN